MALLEYRDICKTYGDFPAVSGINLDVGAGRIVGLLGPNGSGKTTLIKMTTGLLSPTGGTIRVDGNPIGTESKKIVSYLPERTYLDETLTVDRVIDFFSDFYIDFDRIKAYDIVSRLNIDTKRRIKTLSKGTKEKIQLSLVMSRKAKLYLLDEPIAGVDPAAREYILNTVLSNYAENSTVVVSTHLISDVQDVLDDVIFLSHGKIIHTSTVGYIKDCYNKSVDELFREVFRC